METLKRNGWHEVENEREEDGEIVKNLQRQTVREGKRQED